MFKLSIGIIFTWILTAESVREEQIDNVFSERNCGTNSHWLLVDYESLEIASPFRQNSKCIQSGLESCASTASSHFPVGHLALTVYLRLYSDESGLKITLFDENDLPKATFNFNKFDKRYNEGWNQIVLNIKEDFFGYINFLGTSNKDDIIVLDITGYINDYKTTSSRTKWQIQSLEPELQPSYSRVKREMQNLNSISISNYSQEFDNMLKTLQSKDLILNRIETSDLEVINKLLKEISKPEAVSEIETILKPKTDFESNEDLQSGPELELKLGSEPESELGLEPIPESDTPDQGLEQEPKSKSEAGLDLDTESEPELAPERGPESKSKPETELEFETELKPDFETGPELKPEKNYLEQKLDQSLNQTQDQNQTQNSINNKQTFWNPFTITLVTVVTSVVLTICLVSAYHLGKIKARDNNQIVIDDIQPRRIIPRIRNTNRNPLNYDVV